MPRRNVRATHHASGKLYNPASGKLYNSASGNSYNLASGNVLFLILLGVVLFGALSFTLLRTQGTVSDSAEPERLKTQASEIIRYAQDLRRAVDMIRANGVSENDLRFAHPDLDAAYGTYNAAPSNEVFNPAGGGMVYKKPRAEWLDPANLSNADSGVWVFTGNNDVFGIGSPSNGDCLTEASANRHRCAELVVFLPFIKRELCIAINQLLGLGDATTTPAKDNSSISYLKFAGTFGHSNQIKPAAAAYTYKESYCIQGDVTPAAGTYHFFQVLISR